MLQIEIWISIRDGKPRESLDPKNFSCIVKWLKFHVENKVNYTAEQSQYILTGSIQVEIAAYAPNLQ